MGREALSERERSRSIDVTNEALRTADHLKREDFGGVFVRGRRPRDDGSLGAGSNDATSSITIESEPALGSIVAVPQASGTGFPIGAEVYERRMSLLGEGAQGAENQGSEESG
jgi:hypothetical protein